MVPYCSWHYWIITVDISTSSSHRSRRKLFRHTYILLLAWKTRLPVSRLQLNLALIRNACIYGFSQLFDLSVRPNACTQLQIQAVISSVNLWWPPVREANFCIIRLGFDKLANLHPEIFRKKQHCALNTSPHWITFMSTDVCVTIRKHNM